MGKCHITFKCDGALRVRKSVRNFPDKFPIGLVSHPSPLVNVSARVVK